MVVCVSGDTLAALGGCVRDWVLHHPCPLFAFYPSFSEAQQQLCTSKQELSELQKLLEEERDRRLTAENALSLAKEQIQR